MSKLDGFITTNNLDAKVYYGDQAKLYDRIMLCVEPEEKVREISGTHKYKVEIKLSVIVYYTATRPSELNREDADLLTESLEDFLDLDPKLGGLFYHFMVERQVVDDSLTFADTPIRATRMYCVGMYTEVMPNV